MDIDREKETKLENIFRVGIRTIPRGKILSFLSRFH